MARALSIVLVSLAFGVSPALAGDAAAGKATYDGMCSSCHGAAGKGDGPAAAALTPAPRDLSTGDFKFDADKDGQAGGDSDLRLVIQKGAAEFGGSPMMTPWPVSDADAENLVAYLRSLKK